jgi:hypothetical protein
MSVNKFSSSGIKPMASNVTKQYVDSKFITLTKNLDAKVNKSGDTMVGDLDMGVMVFIILKTQ